MSSWVFLPGNGSVTFRGGVDLEYPVTLLGGRMAIGSLLRKTGP